MTGIRAQAMTRCGAIRRTTRACACVAAIVLITNTATAQAPAPTGAPPAPEARPAPFRPGLFGAIGRWLDETSAGLTAGVGSTRGTLDNFGTQAGGVANDAATTARDAAGTVIRIPATGMVVGRQICPRTAGGGPDCRAGSEALCRSKGYTGGRSLDIQTADKCPGWVWASGQRPPEGACTTETYVTRALCQ
jgi:hypothetical protein